MNRSTDLYSGEYTTMKDAYTRQNYGYSNAHGDTIQPHIPPTLGNVTFEHACRKQGSKIPECTSSEQQGRNAFRAVNRAQSLARRQSTMSLETAHWNRMHRQRDRQMARLEATQNQDQS